MGLLGQVSRTIRAKAHIQDLRIAEICQQTMILISEYQKLICPVASAKSIVKNPEQALKPDRPRNEQLKSILCWTCGQDGHIS